MTLFVLSDCRFDSFLLFIFRHLQCNWTNMTGKFNAVRANNTEQLGLQGEFELFHQVDW
jgi:hypothetical protein